jgi:histidinol-phosphatase (PHP family)
MLDLYEESAIEGIESGIFAYMAHPDLFMNSYPEFDQPLYASISRHICRAAVRNNIPLEYNLLTRFEKAGAATPVPCPEFWHIAASEGCTAIIGVDAHDPKALATNVYYDQAAKELKELGIKTIDHI